MSKIMVYKPTKYVALFLSFLLPMHSAYASLASRAGRQTTKARVVIPTTTTTRRPVDVKLSTPPTNKPTTSTSTTSKSKFAEQKQGQYKQLRHETSMTTSTSPWSTGRYIPSETIEPEPEQLPTQQKPKSPGSLLIEALKSSSADDIPLEVFKNAQIAAQENGNSFGIVTTNAAPHGITPEIEKEFNITRKIAIPGGSLVLMSGVGDFIVIAQSGSDPALLQKTFRSPIPLKVKFTQEPAQLKEEVKAAEKIEKQELIDIKEQEKADALEQQRIEEENAAKIKLAEQEAAIEAANKLAQEKEVDAQLKDLESEIAEIEENEMRKVIEQTEQEQAQQLQELQQKHEQIRMDSEKNMQETLEQLDRELITGQEEIQAKLQEAKNELTLKQEQSERNARQETELINQAEQQALQETEALKQSIKEQKERATVNALAQDQKTVEQLDRELITGQEEIQTKLQEAKNELKQTQEKNELEAQQETELINQAEQRALQEAATLEQYIKEQKERALETIRKTAAEELTTIENEELRITQAKQERELAQEKQKQEIAREQETREKKIKEIEEAEKKAQEIESRKMAEDAAKEITRNALKLAEKNEVHGDADDRRKGQPVEKEVEQEKEEIKEEEPEINRRSIGFPKLPEFPESEEAPIDTESIPAPETEPLPEIKPIETTPKKPVSYGGTTSPISSMRNRSTMAQQSPAKTSQQPEGEHQLEIRHVDLTRPFGTTTPKSPSRSPYRPSYTGTNNFSPVTRRENSGTTGGQSAGYLPTDSASPRYFYELPEQIPAPPKPIKTAVKTPITVEEIAPEKEEEGTTPKPKKLNRLRKKETGRTKPAEEVGWFQRLIVAIGEYIRAFIKLFTG